MYGADLQESTNGIYALMPMERSKVLITKSIFTLLMNKQESGMHYYRRMTLGCKIDNRE